MMHPLKTKGKLTNGMQCTSECTTTHTHELYW